MIIENSLRLETAGAIGSLKALDTQADITDKKLDAIGARLDAIGSGQAAQGLDSLGSSFKRLDSGLLVSARNFDTVGTKVEHTGQMVEDLGTKTQKVAQDTVTHTDSINKSWDQTTTQMKSDLTDMSRLVSDIAQQRKQATSEVERAVLDQKLAVAKSSLRDLARDSAWADLKRQAQDLGLAWDDTTKKIISAQQAASTGGGGGGGGGFLRGLGGGAGDSWRRNRSLLWRRGGLMGMGGLSLATILGLGPEHLVGAGLAVGGSAAGAAGGAGLLGLGALGTAAVGGGSDAAVMKSTIADVGTLDKAYTNLSKAQALYGGNSKQAQAATQQLNFQMAELGNTAGVKAEAGVAKAAAALNHFWDVQTSPARVQASKILMQGLDVGRTFVPLVAGAADRNLGIIDQQIKPLIGWLQSSSGGIKIFKDLENEFASNLPHAVHAFSQAFELALRTMDMVAPSIGGITAHLDSLFTRLNSLSNEQLYVRYIDPLLYKFQLWENLIKAAGHDIRLLMHAGAGEGDNLVITMTNILQKWGAWEQSAKGQNFLQTFFRQRGAELQSIVGLLGAAARVAAPMYAALQPLVPVITAIATGIADVVNSLVDLGHHSKVFEDAVVLPMGALLIGGKLIGFRKEWDLLKNSILGTGAALRSVTTGGGARGALGAFKSEFAGGAVGGMGQVSGIRGVEMPGSLVNPIVVAVEAGESAGLGGQGAGMLGSAAQRDAQLAQSATSTAASTEARTAGGVILPAGVRSVAPEAAAVAAPSLLSRAAGVGGNLLRGGLAGGAIFLGGTIASDLAGKAIGGTGGGDVAAFGHGAAAGGGIGATIGSVIPGVGTGLGAAAGAVTGGALGGGLHLLNQGGAPGIGGGALTGAALGNAVLPILGAIPGALIGGIAAAAGLIGPSAQELRGQKLMKDVQQQINTANADVLQNLQTRLDESKKEKGLTQKQTTAVQDVVTQRGLQLLAPGVQSFSRQLASSAYKPTEPQIAGALSSRLSVLGGPRDVFGGPGLQLNVPHPITRAQGTAAEAMIGSVAQAEQQGKVLSGTTDQLIGDMERRWKGFGAFLKTTGFTSFAAFAAEIKQSHIAQNTQDVVNEMNKKWPFLIPAAKVGVKNYEQVIVDDLGRLRGAISQAHGKERQDLINHYNQLKGIASNGMKASLDQVKAAQAQNAKEVLTGGKPILDNARKTWAAYRDNIKVMVDAGVISQKQGNDLMKQNNDQLGKVIAAQTGQIVTQAFSNWGHYQSAVSAAAGAAAGATKTGVMAIQSAADQILKSLGAQGIPPIKVDTSNIGAAAASAGQAAAQGAAGATAGQRRTAMGGRVPGSVSGDTWTLVDPAGIPQAKVGGAELLIGNRHTEARVDNKLALGARMGLWEPTSLDREVHEEHVPHSFATGGRLRGYATGGLAAGGQGLQSAGAGYLFPFSPPPEAWERTDMGVDFSLAAGTKIGPIGRARVGPQASWGQYGPYVEWQLLDGPRAGQWAYVAEGITNIAAPGSIVNPDQAVAIGTHGPFGIEYGWGTSTPGQTLASVTSGYSEGQVTPAGSDMRNFLLGLTHGQIVGGGVSGPGAVVVPKIKVPSVTGKGAFANATRAALKKATDAANKYDQAHAGTGTGATGATAGTLPGGVVTASWFDDPQTASGHVHVPGWAELSHQGSLDFSAMGHLPMGEIIKVSYGGQTITIPKVDVGAGGAPIAPATIRGIDLTREAAAMLPGFINAGLANVTWQDTHSKAFARGGRLDNRRRRHHSRDELMMGAPDEPRHFALGGLAGPGFAGWYRDGGSFVAHHPTLVGVGEGQGSEVVTVEPVGRGGAGSRGGVVIQNLKVENHRRGDVKAMILDELEQVNKALEDGTIHDPAESMR